MFANLYLELCDWNQVRKKVMDDNLLQMRTFSSSQKVSGQICTRLKSLTANELEYFSRATELEKGYLLWVAICRAYLFIREFAVEIIREKHISMQPGISHEDFDIFYNTKSQWDDVLDKIKPSTRLKLRQVLFRMMREARLISDELKILPAVMSSDLASIISEQDSQDMYVFPMKVWD